MSVEQLQLHQRMNSENQNPTLMGDFNPKEMLGEDLKSAKHLRHPKEYDSERHSACAKNPP